MTDPACIYRDATISLAARNDITSIYRWLKGFHTGFQTGFPTEQEIASLGEVIDRWDANEATEIIIEEQPA